LKYRTTRKLGYLPKGVTVEVVRLSLTSPGDPLSRDYGAFGADGDWLVVKWPSGDLEATVQTMDELAELGIRPGDLEEISGSS
jgi:hypothetical protein